VTFDARLTLARPDLAEAALEGVLKAQRFARATPMRCAASAAALRIAPDVSAEQSNQLLFGERFDVLESKDGWAWGQAARDAYVGFVETAALSDEGSAPTHWVSALRAFAFEAPAIRSAARGPFSLNALVTVDAEEVEFLHAADAGWFHRRHLTPIGYVEDDYVAVAERFVGAPYLWGGRDSAGVDCSGLVQQALFACGLACPRDADQQAALGEPAPADALIRGDLVCWPDHIGIMLDGERLLHASAFLMQTALEPLAEVARRVENAGRGLPTAYRRLARP